MYMLPHWTSAFPEFPELSLVISNHINLKNKNASKSLLLTILFNIMRGLQCKFYSQKDWGLKSSSVPTYLNYTHLEKYLAKNDNY